MVEATSLSVILIVWCSFLLPRGAATAATAPPSLTTCAGSSGSPPPVMLGEPLPFCGRTGLSCCDTADDAALRDELHALDVTPDDAACAKSLLCARCNPSLSPVFNTVDLTTAMEFLVPLLCSTSSSSAQHQHSTDYTTGSWAHQEDNMCLERISARSFQTMDAHPDGSGRVFLSTRGGKIFLATVPRQGSGGTLRARLFLDLTDRVHHDAVLGLVGVAFHPEFAMNGRFFVSYNCDSVTSPACGVGRCWGAAAGNQSRPCRYQLAVAEFSAKGGAEATYAAPSEVRRIFTLGLPQPHKLYSYQRHGGQILLRPGNSDGYLYLITGNGDFSKNKRSSLFGKIMRFNVVGVGRSRPQPSIPGTPKMMDKPEIFTVGLNNPSACSFDSDMPSHLFCADVNEQLYERVYLVMERTNYGRSSSSNSSMSIVVNRGRPAEGRMPSIVGGIVYRGSADPSLNGRYLYVYSAGVWTGASVLAEGWSSRRYASPKPKALKVRCSKNSAVPCEGSGIGGRVLSLSEDNSKDAFFLTTGGVFRVVPPSSCSVPTPQPPPEWPPGTRWVLFVGALILLYAYYICYRIRSMASGGGNISILNNLFKNASFISINCNKKST